MKPSDYNQCSLKHSDGRHQVAWIPSKFAVVGEVLKIKKSDGAWDNGWIVESVGATATDPEVNAMHNFWKKYRKAIDVPQGTFKQA